MKLSAHTPAGTGLELDVLLTGHVREDSGKNLHAVEIMLPAGCVSVDGYGAETLKTPSGRAVLWATPGDIRTDDGSTVNHDQLRAEVVRVTEQRRLDMLRGSLGENWP